MIRHSSSIGSNCFIRFSKELRIPESPFEIMRILTEAGARPERVIIGHMDRTIHKYDELVKFADEWKSYIQYDLFGVETSHYQMADCFYPSDGERLNRLKVHLPIITG